jgi:hypothetical protein
MTRQILEGSSLAAAAGTGPPGNIAFALSPALASSTLINYQSGEGIKIYGKATSPLDTLFDGDAGALRLFLSKVQHRATQFGWNAILQITQAGMVYNCIENYGQDNLESIHIQATTIEGTNGRDTQNSSQVYTFLITSITDGLLGKVISQKGDYTSATGFQDGPSLLKKKSSRYLTWTRGPRQGTFDNVSQGCQS